MIFTPLTVGRINWFPFNLNCSLLDGQDIKISENEVKLLGGSKRLANFIAQERELSKKDGSKVLCLDVGDLFLGYLSAAFPR